MEKVFLSCPNDKYLHNNIKLYLEDIYKIQKCILQWFVHASRMKTNQIKDHLWLFAALKERKRNRMDTQMRQIDGMKENLTRINGTAGNNHDGEKEK